MTDSDKREVLSGLVERVTFHNEENGFTVLRVKVRGRHDTVSIVGYAAGIAAGELVQATGSWTNDRHHGLQFRADFIKTMPPTTREGIEKYLGSGMIRGVGRVYATKLVEAFGEKVFDVIELEPERLREVEGIGPKRAGQIIAGWSGQRVIREIMVFLHSHGVGTSRAVRIFKTYGADAVRVISENPYQLSRDIQGIGFRTADAIAMKLGIEKTAMIRVRAGVAHALLEALYEGHCGLPRAELLPRAVRLLEVPESSVNEALWLELEGGELIADDVEGSPCVFLAALYRAEQTIAGRLAALNRTPLPWPRIDADKAVPWVERKIGQTLAQSQKRAVDLALSSKVLVITGGPGVGKTTLVNAILHILEVKNVEILLAAPTGRAAKRMSETTGREARTIHRLLEVNLREGGFRHNAENPLECDLLVIDEASMVDVMLMSALLKAVPDHAALILVGDVDQLPSVGPGQVLADIIASHAVPVAHLTEVFRQAAQSRIIQAAHCINRGELPDLARPSGDSDFYFVPADTPERAVELLLHMVKSRLPARFGVDAIRDIQILCPMNRGGIGARSLNLELQKALNPNQELKVEKFGTSYAVGDKVMQIQNDYDKDIYNGDVGFVSAIDPDAGQITIDFDGRPIAFMFGELDQVVLAYAVTIHKSQGSEYPVVVIPVMTQNFTMLQRNLLYTAVTRGKRLVVLLGQKKAVTIAVKNISGRRRVTRLKAWLEVDVAKPAAECQALPSFR